ncbi:MAG TPA: DNA adenine methylase [Caldilineaceae bacterium]|nr:DNA adenine methylase [Caldilineaceae bacterium]
MLNRLPQPIPYQGSKRTIAAQILKYMPCEIARIIEPFAGSAAVSIAAAYRGLAGEFLLNDLNRPLADLLRLMIDRPTEIADKYQQLWTAQLGQERAFYDEVRTRFNQTHQPELLLYLLARCVKASVRYNANGEFNQAPDNRRKGRHPESMRQEIGDFSRLLIGKTLVTGNDFRATASLISPSTDFVYLDPPYQGTSGRRDSRYRSGVAHCDLVDYLETLNQRKIMFALSYDGVKGDKTYGVELPTELKLYKMLLHAGRSTQSTLLGRSDITYESLYLSAPLVARLDSQVVQSAERSFIQVNLTNPAFQLKLELSGV